MRDTYFAPAERATQETLVYQREALAKNSVINALLETVGGLLAVLNKDRQIVSLNNSFLDLLEIKDPQEALGLRTGEALKCVHSDCMTAGCGTSEYCSTCGAAIAMISSLKENKPAENTCALKTKKDGELVDLVLQIKSHPILIDDSIYLLVFLQDVTIEQKRAVLERTFFHDINNMLSGLVGASELLASQHDKSPMVDIVRRSSLRLQKAVEIQKFLLDSNMDTFNLVPQQVTYGQVREDLLSFFAEHPMRQHKELEISSEFEDFVLTTDITLAERVLANMITNALEASHEGDKVSVWASVEAHAFSFNVHNDQVIPEDIKLRIFQRNFSTKGSVGRGVGTFSMKLFGERFLGGKVAFVSSNESGTIFSLSLPV